MESVDKSKMCHGIWHNVTRAQKVEVLNFTNKIVEYYYEHSALPDKMHVKSIEHFLRSYTKK